MTIAHPPATVLEKFPAGLFEEGQLVRLRRPRESRASFDKPKGDLVVVAKFWFRRFEGPTYALRDPAGGIAVTPFRDDDLRAAR